VELALVIGRKGSRIPKDKAMDHVAGYALALDMTERRLQKLASSKGEPWAIAKGYDTFLPISDMIPSSKIKDPSNVDLWCKVDGELRQKGNTKDMIFKVDWLISYISRIMTLEEGDVILTGTPSGVGPVHDGQQVSCGMLYEEKTLSEFTIEAKAAT
jgi:acylpyruvate hydrolase